jgi:hypothetical protein
MFSVLHPPPTCQCHFDEQPEHGSQVPGHTACTLLLLLLCQLFSTTAPHAAACALRCAGEGAGIREWVAYHRSIGVERFYVYDHGSEPPFKDLLEDFIQSGLVVYRFLDGAIGRPGERPQLAIYNDCIQQHRAKSIWLGGCGMPELVCFAHMVGARWALPSFADCCAAIIPDWVYAVQLAAASTHLAVPACTTAAHHLGTHAA